MDDNVNKHQYSTLKAQLASQCHLFIDLHGFIQPYCRLLCGLMVIAFTRLLGLSGTNKYIRLIGMIYIALRLEQINEMGGKSD